LWPQGACLEDTRVSTSRRDILFRQKHHHKTSRSHTWRPETGRWADTWHWQICHPCITPTQPLPLSAPSPVAGAAACTPCPAGSYTAATGAVDVSSDVASERRSCGNGRMRISCARLEREHTKRVLSRRLLIRRLHPMPRRNILRVHWCASVCASVFILRRQIFSPSVLIWSMQVIRHYYPALSLPCPCSLCLMIRDRRCMVQCQALILLL
jgi:hypothetical protein